MDPSAPTLSPSPQSKRRRTSKRRRNNTGDAEQADVELEQHVVNVLMESVPSFSNGSTAALETQPVTSMEFELERPISGSNGESEPSGSQTGSILALDEVQMFQDRLAHLAIMPVPTSGTEESTAAIAPASLESSLIRPTDSVTVQPSVEIHTRPNPVELEEARTRLPIPSRAILDAIEAQSLAIPSVETEEALTVETQLNPSNQSLVCDHGWQESRLLLTERSKFLLNNPRMSDIRFLVGETNVEIFGHKTILAMGSPVFEAQFFGSMKSDVETIELPDLEPETFLLFLKYLYTDTLDESIDDMKVLQLLRPAKKYIVPHLIEKCSDILMSELRAENVFQVYNYAVFFDLKKLEGACLRFLDRECEAIIQTEEFTMLNSQNLANFLKRDGLNIKEHVLFKAVLRWAELECERLSVEPTDPNIRGALADNLRLIRFPTMSTEEFATEVASRNILTAEESRSIFIFMCSGHHNRLSPALTPDFPVKKRDFYPQQYLVSRFSGEPVPHSLNYRSGEIYTYRINFKADRQIFFKGVNIFSIKCGMNAQYVDQRRFNGAVCLHECDVIAGDRDLSRKKAHKQFTRESSLESEHETSSGSRYFPVLFDQELRIPANQMFTISAVVSVASSSYQQQPLNTCMGTDEVLTAVVKCAEDLHVNFTFSNCFEGESSVGKYTQSQIPEIIFSL